MVIRILGKFNATASRNYDSFTKSNVWDVTIFDRHDTHVVYTRQHTDIPLSALRGIVSQIIRAFSAQDVASWLRNMQGEKVIGLAYEADLHCIECSHARYGHKAVWRVINTQVDNDNVISLLHSGYPADREGNALTRYTLDEAVTYYREDGMVPCCGDCMIPLVNKDEYTIEN